MWEVETHEEASAKSRPESYARPQTAAAEEEEPWLGSGSIFKVEPMVFADKSGLGHERVRVVSNTGLAGEDLGRTWGSRAQLWAFGV